MCESASSTGSEGYAKLKSNRGGERRGRNRVGVTFLSTRTPRGGGRNRQSAGADPSPQGRSTAGGSARMGAPFPVEYSRVFRQSPFRKGMPMKVHGGPVDTRPNIGAHSSNPNTTTVETSLSAAMKDVSEGKRAENRELRSATSSPLECWQQRAIRVDLFRRAAIERGRRSTLQRRSAKDRGTLKRASPREAGQCRLQHDDLSGRGEIHRLNFSEALEDGDQGRGGTCSTNPQWRGFSNSLRAETSASLGTRSTYTRASIFDNPVWSSRTSFR